MKNTLLDELRIEVKAIETMIKMNNHGTSQERYMNMAYDIVVRQLKDLIQRYE